MFSNKDALRILRSCRKSAKHNLIEQDRNSDSGLRSRQISRLRKESKAIKKEDTQQVELKQEKSSPQNDTSNKFILKQKKKVKIIPQQQPELIVYKPTSDNRIYDVAAKMKRLDRFNVLLDPINSDLTKSIISKASFPLLYNETQKAVADPENAWRQWFNQASEPMEKIDSIFKPFIIPVNLEHTKMISSTEFALRAGSNYYWSGDEVIKDLKKLFAWTYYYRVFDMCSMSYLIQLWEQVDVLSQRLIQSISEDKRKDMDILFQMKSEFKLDTEQWPYIPQETRKYEVISEYEPNPSDKKYRDIVEKKLRTEKKPIVCESSCVCFRAQEFGQFSLENQTWDSKCPNRARRIQCGSHTGTTQNCLNQSIKLKNYKVLGQDVDETLCWGIDIYTRNIIYFCLPVGGDEKHKQQFISSSLMKACNLLVEKGYDLRAACQSILQYSIPKKDRTTNNVITGRIFSSVDRRYAKSVLSAIELDTQRQVFRAHTKGVGVICKHQDGIKNNELLIQYIGEIYQPWRWFEKQDFIKKKMKDHNQKDVLPDFYNITLEMHKDDPKGVDILFVDPINKGNYSSRLSHSCDPNCGTVTTVVDGRYTIGMYALKGIEYGEELSFDYCSTTESKQEYRQALCLCGQEKCRIRYLDLNFSKEQNNIMDKYHCFLERNSCLLRACIVDAVKDEDNLLDLYNIRSSVLEDCPPWLIQWTINILEFVSLEYFIIIKRLRNFQFIEDQKSLQIHKNEEIINFLASQYTESRIQNLIITLDKIKYYLNSVKEFSPPLQLLTDQQIVSDIWNDWNASSSNKRLENSIIQELKSLLFSKRDKRSTVQEPIVAGAKQYRQLMQSAYDLIQQESMLAQHKMMVTRLLFLCISHVLFQDDLPGVHSEALSVILYLMSFTYTYFRPHEYAAFQSVKFDIHEIEWCKIGGGEFKKAKPSSRKLEQKGYSSQFIWGQLVGWFKQTVANPQASLSQDRRGTLSYPSFVQSFLTQDKSYPFQEQTQNGNARAFFIQHLLQKPSYMWPPENATWSYKNSYKIYGTVLFESVYSKKLLGENFLQEILTQVEGDFSSKFRVFCEMEQRVYGTPIQTIMEVQKNFEMYIGSNELNLSNKFIQPILKHKKSQKEKKIGTQGLIEEIPQKYKLNPKSQEYYEQDLMKRRRIMENVKDPVDREFCLDKLKIFSIAFGKS